VLVGLFTTGPTLLMLNRRRAHGSQRSLGVELGVPAALAVSAVVLMVAFVAGSDGLVSDIARVVASFEARRPESEAGGLTIVDDAPSVCCEGFYAGGRRALAGVLLGGIPLAVVGWFPLVELAAQAVARGPRVGSRWCAGVWYFSW